MIARRKPVLLFALCLLGCPDRDHIEGVARAEAPAGSRAAGVARDTAAHAPGTLKLASWNLEWLNRSNGTGAVKRTEADYKRLRSYVDRLAADVIAFQEVDGPEAAVRVFDPARYRVHVATRGDSQRTGFAVRHGIELQVHPDYDALDVGQLRAGADITVHSGALTLRLLSVHLKSGCFDGPLAGAQRDCQRLAQQLPLLEAWIDARGREKVAAVVLGDFNRRLFGRKDDPFWAQLDDADPPASDLWSPTDGQRSSCWSGDYPAFIDHIVLNVPAKRASIGESFELLSYDASDAARRNVLSDHCPISLSFDEDGYAPATGPAVAVPKPKSAPPEKLPAQAPTEHANTPIKGNLSGRGKKLYHLPACPDYPRVEIDEGKGEQWFATPGQAEAAGFSKAGNCP
jgi:endonuclease/exonuclease/phosphatase family metal-dependent hydrolase